MLTTPETTKEEDKEEGEEKEKKPKTKTTKDIMRNASTTKQSQDHQEEADPQRKLAEEDPDEYNNKDKTSNGVCWWATKMLAVGSESKSALTCLMSALMEVIWSQIVLLCMKH